MRFGRGVASGQREDLGAGPGWPRAAEGKLWAGWRETGPPAPCARIPRQYPAPRAPRPVSRPVSCLCPGPSASALSAGVGKWGRRCGGGGAPACLVSDPRDPLAWAGLGGDSAAEGGRPAHLAPPPRLPKLCLYLPILDQPTRHPGSSLPTPLLLLFFPPLPPLPSRGAELLPFLQDRQCCGFASPPPFISPPTTPARVDEEGAESVGGGNKVLPLTPSRLPSPSRAEIWPKLFSSPGTETITPRKQPA